VRTGLDLTPEKGAEFRKDLVDFYRGYITPANSKLRGGQD
jgi:hypothetical protein